MGSHLTATGRHFAIYMGSHSVTCHPTQVNAPRLNQGRSQKFVSDGTKPEDWGQKSPSGLQEQSPGGGLGRSLQKLKTYMLITIAIMC